jgi:hypothetical protein
LKITSRKYKVLFARDYVPLSTRDFVWRLLQVHCRLLLVTPSVPGTLASSRKSIKEANLGGERAQSKKEAFQERE